VDDDDIPEHSVHEVIVHHHWKHNDESFDADISLIILSTPVDLSDPRVGIACLPTASNALPGTGTIIGWGITENSTEYFEPTPSELEIPAVSEAQCFRADPRLSIISSRRTFCAGFVNQGKAACPGDSGGGFFTYDRKAKAYQIEGIVSASLNDPYGNCVSNMFSIFTNVAKYLCWIEVKVDETTEVRLKDVRFDCEPKSDELWVREPSII
jgi:secreted trypsin-like serine protease